MYRDILSVKNMTAGFFTRTASQTGVCTILVRPPYTRDLHPSEQELNYLSP